MRTTTNSSRHKTPARSSGNRSTKKKLNNRKQGAPRKGRKIALLSLLLFLAIIIVAVGLATPLLAERAPATARIYIPRDCTKEMLNDTLVKYFGKEYAKTVGKLVGASGRDLSTRRGSYVIEKGTPAFKAQRLLTHGAQAPVKLTINGFRNFDEMIARVAAKFEFTADQLAEAASDSKTLEEFGLTPESKMALWVDDTYEFYWSDTPRHVVNKIGENYKRIWNDENKKKAQSLGRTPAEVTILASIAAEETNFVDEQGRVGRLYNNRLQKGMKLQADPTIRFALNDFTIKRVGGNMLKTVSPYNTYLHAGLPPGPIRTSNAETIEAILNSPPSDDLYMCAKEDFSGYHNFANNYQDHLANAERYRKALDQKGIKL